MYVRSYIQGRSNGVNGRRRQPGMRGALSKICRGREDGKEEEDSKEIIKQRMYVRSYIQGRSNGVNGRRRQPWNARGFPDDGGEPSVVLASVERAAGEATRGDLSYVAVSELADVEAGIRCFKRQSAIRGIYCLYVVHSFSHMNQK
ncbi:hypothetical protein ACLOJK_007826 [Asimina triloba]